MHPFLQHKINCPQLREIQQTYIKMKYNSDVQQIYVHCICDNHPSVHKPMTHYFYILKSVA